MKTVAKISLAFGGAILIGGIAAGSWFYFNPNPIDKIKNAVRESLNDPDSAKFSKITFNSETGYGCGLVNARNKLGGYVGKKRFVVSIDDGDVSFDPEKEVPNAPAEQPLSLTMPSTSIGGMRNDVINSLNATLARGREINAWVAASSSAHAENAAFQALVDAKCLNSPREGVYR